MRPVDLKHVASGRYLIRLDQAANPRSNDPWMLEIPCRKGVVIYPHSSTHLAVEIEGRPGLVKKVMAINGATVHQDGDYEKTVLIPEKGFEELVKLAKPKRRRVISSEVAQRRVATLIKARQIRARKRSANLKRPRHQMMKPEGSSPQESDILSDKNIGRASMLVIAP